MKVVDFLEKLNPETEVILALSMILFAGFIMTRLTNTLNMPKVSGYILAGILIGPYCLNFIPEHIIEDMGFISDVALAFIAFGVGKFFKKEVLMNTGRKIIVITVSEALTAGVLVTLVLKVLFKLDWGFALILGAIATATAPASTMMTINQYKAKGEFVNTLLQIVALDDVVCLLAFSIVSAVINGLEAGHLLVQDILVPIGYNLLAICLGVFCGYFLSRLLVPTRSRDNRLILAIAMLMGLTGLCAAVNISPLLSCMVFGAVYINLTRDKKLFRQINNFTPPVMSLFFVVSGMNLNLKALTTVGAIGVCYFLVRIIGKYLGTYLSCLAMKTSREIRNYMGLALIPQAGVAIGLAFLGQRILPETTGTLMLTIILSSSVLYEMVGPICAKAALFLSGSIPGGTMRLHRVETENGRILDVPADAADKAVKTAKAGKAPLSGAGKERARSADEAAGAGSAPPSAAGANPASLSGTEKRQGQLDIEAEGTAGPAVKAAGKGPAHPLDETADAASALPGTEASGADAAIPAAGEGAAPLPESGADAAPLPAAGAEEAPPSGAGKVLEPRPESADRKDGGETRHSGHKGAGGAADAGGDDRANSSDGTAKKRSHAKKAPKVKKISTDPEMDLTLGLPELEEYNKGVDERDDDDVEKMVKHLKPKPKKKKKKK